jgi:hypothetical protein
MKKMVINVGVLSWVLPVLNNEVKFVETASCLCATKYLEIVYCRHFKNILKTIHHCCHKCALVYWAL